MTHESDVSISDVQEPDHAPAEQDTPVLVELETTENSANDLSAIRELVLHAHPDVVPELISGATVDDLMASIEPAEAAYRRVSESLRASDADSTQPTPTVPAGGDRPMPVDPDRLPASEKIRRGLAHR
jgi:hypothetical protein